MKLKKFNLKSVDSTNNKAIKLIKKGRIKPAIILAANQTNGRGQYGKKWISVSGNLFISIFFNISFRKSVMKITHENCQIIRNVLQKFSNKKINIKKPNDLLIDKHKVCGILQEILIYKKKKYIIVGVGINVNKSPKIYRYSTTYLSKFLSKKINKLLIYNAIKNSYEQYLNK